MIHAFDAFTADPPLILEGVGVVPRYGSLTLNEYLFWVSCSAPTAPELPLNLHMQALDLHVQQLAATVLLISRVDRSWTLHRVAAEIPAEPLGKLAEFFLNEYRRWKEPEEVTPIEDGEEVEERKPPDWNEIYWRLKAGYPGEARFSRENFGNCPLLVIESALESLLDRNIEQWNAHALPIALFAMYNLAAKGAEVELNHFNPYAELLERKLAKRSDFPSDLAKLLLSLAGDRLLPGWVIDQLDVEDVRRSAEA